MWDARNDAFGLGLGRADGVGNRCWEGIRWPSAEVWG